MAEKLNGGGVIDLHSRKAVKPPAGKGRKRAADAAAGAEKLIEQTDAQRAAAKRAENMAKADAAAPEGHNAKAADEAEERLLLKWLSLIRAQMAKADTAKAAFDVEKDALNSLFSGAKGDKFSRKELTELLTDSTARARDLQKEEDRRAKLRRWAGLPAGSQADLFAATPEETRDEISYRADGYQAGMRGLEPKPPSDVPARFAQPWLEGYHEGQAKIAWSMAAKSPNTPGGPAEPTPLEEAAAGDDPADAERAEAEAGVEGELEESDHAGAPDGAEVV